MGGYFYGTIQWQLQWYRFVRSDRQRICAADTPAASTGSSAGTGSTADSAAYGSLCAPAQQRR